MSNNGMTKMLLGMLKKKNPQGYNFIMQAQKSGKNPNQILKEMVSSGQVSKADLQKLQNNPFGIKIPQGEIDNITKDSRGNNNIFNGF